MSIANRQQRVMPKRTDAVRRGAQATEMMDAMAGDLSGWIDGVDRGGGGERVTVRFVAAGNSKKPQSAQRLLDALASSLGSNTPAK